MPNIAVILKQEIARVARKEARSLTKSLFMASAQFRRNIAELKRWNSKAHAEIARLQRQALKDVSAPITQADTAKVRFTVRSVKAQRKRLGISAADFGKLVNVTAHTVYMWEHGTSRPRKAQVAAFAALRSLGKREAKQRLEQLGRNAAKGRKTTK